MWIKGRPTWLVGGFILASTLGITLTWLLWPDPAPTPPRERAYLSSTACLLTDDRGLASDTAQAAWAGMQDASDQSRIKVQYLSVSGPQTSANASAYFNNLGLQKCKVIIAVGEAPVAAMEEGAQRFPDSLHAVIGNHDSASAITAIEGSSANTIRNGVRQLVGDAAMK